MKPFNTMNALMVLFPVGLFIFLGSYFIYYQNIWLGDNVDMYQAGYHIILFIALLVALIWFNKQMNESIRKIETTYQEVMELNDSEGLKASLKRATGRSKQRVGYVNSMVVIAMLSNLFSLLTNLLQFIK